MGLEIGTETGIGIVLMTGTVRGLGTKIEIGLGIT